MLPEADEPTLPGTEVAPEVPEVGLLPEMAEDATCRTPPSSRLLALERPME